jgi:hypothetical protein
MLNSVRKEYPFLKASKRKPDALKQYYSEITDLGTAGLYKILDHGREWAEKIANNLAIGGGAIFPHTYLSKCGYQIAAVIHGILDSGANQVILLGTVHGFPGELLDARIKELNEENIVHEASWGVLDPDSAKTYLLKQEFSLDLFKALWRLEVERRGITPPKLFERYPCLTNRQPSKLPGINELKELAKNSVIVGTDDYCHHGIAYGVQKEAALLMNEQGFVFAKKQIELGFSWLMQNDYRAYFDHWMNPNAIGDPSDVTVVMHYLIGKQASPKILDLKLVDVSPLFEKEPKPSWVAATLAIM